MVTFLRKIGSVILSVGLAAAVVGLAATITARASWVDGLSYEFSTICNTGNWYTAPLYDQSPWKVSGQLRTFGSAPTVFTVYSGGLPVLQWSLSDAYDTFGLPPTMGRLRFTITNLTPPEWGPGACVAGLSGLLGSDLFAPSALEVKGLPLPGGATFVDAMTLANYYYVDGYPLRVDFYAMYGSGLFNNNPGSGFFTLGITSGFFDSIGPLSGMGVPYAKSVTYEIIMDNVPEPLTIGLLAAGGLGVGLSGLRTRRRAA